MSRAINNANMDLPPQTTVVASKQAFIRDQVRHLSAPLALPSDFKASTTLPPKAVDAAMAEVNRLFTRHTKSVYHAARIDDIAIQIDRTYWEQAEPSEGYRRADGDDGAVRRTEDLADDKVISRLASDSFPSDEHAERYMALQRLAERRREAREKQYKYRALQRQIAFLKDAQATVQPNLPGRGVALEEELAKSRSLANRVSMRVAGVKRRRDDSIQDNEAHKDSAAEFAAFDEKEKIKTILEN